MGLDVTLYGNPQKETCHCCGNEYEQRECLYDDNITHNLGKMAQAAGLYYALWRPEEMGATKASDLIETLKKGIIELKTSPEKFKALNPPNGWGSYDGLLKFASAYLEACEQYPDSTIFVSR